MPHELYNSVDEMLAPEMVSQLAGERVSSVHCAPIEHNGQSGSQLLAVETNDGRGPRYVLKRTSIEHDWIMRATDDQRCRSVRLWKYGLLDRLGSHIDHGIVACARDGSGWGILMRDVRGELLPEGRPRNAAENERLLDAMAAQHAAFWEAAELTDPSLGLCNLPEFFNVFLPATAYKESHHPCLAVRLIVEGWELLPTLVEPDVVDILARLMADPQPLCDALLRYPRTLVHGDWRTANLGVSEAGGAQVIVLDWQLATFAPPALDVAYVSGSRFYTAIAYYQQSLERRLGYRLDEVWWQPQLELGALGNALRIICFTASHIARSESDENRAQLEAHLSWMATQVRKGVRWL